MACFGRAHGLRGSLACPDAVSAGLGIIRIMLMPYSGRYVCLRDRAYYQVVVSGAIRCLRLDNPLWCLFWDLPSSFSLLWSLVSLPLFSAYTGVSSYLFFSCLLSPRFHVIVSPFPPAPPPLLDCSPYLAISHSPLPPKWTNPLSPTRLPCTMCNAAEVLLVLLSCSITSSLRPTVCALVARLG